MKLSINWSGNSRDWNKIILNYYIYFEFLKEKKKRHIMNMLILFMITLEMCDLKDILKKSENLY